MEKDYTTAYTVFLQLGNLLQRLGLELSPSKDWPPSTCKPFLGLVYDSVKMSIEMPQDKLDSITLVVRTWLNTPCATESAPQSLISKLVFVSTCIFMQCTLNVAVADADFKLRRGPGFNLLAQPAFPPSVISLFSTQNKEGPRAPQAPPLQVDLPFLSLVIVEPFLSLIQWHVLDSF